MGEWLRAMARTLMQWRRERLELRQLLAKDDRMRRDIGVDRYDVLIELRRPFWDWAGRD